MKIPAKIKNFGDNCYADIEIQLSEFDIEVFKRYTIEIIQFPEHGVHSIYLVYNEEDVISITFNPYLKNAARNAFEILYERAKELHSTKTKLLSSGESK